MSNQSPSKPFRLAEKLLQIRKSLNLSQNELLIKPGVEDRLFRSNISQYKLGNREPSLTVILVYARLANIYVDVLIDNELELPVQIPSQKKSSGIKKQKNWLKKICNFIRYDFTLPTLLLRILNA